MFTITTDPIQPQRLAAELNAPEIGARVCFTGVVRDHHDGRQVQGLTYEAFPEMAIRVGNEILEQAKHRFAIHSARAEHRIGALQIGEPAVWVGVSAAHRREAFPACRWIMDQLKADVPIWKKEAYTEGPSAWVSAGEGSRTPPPSDPAADPRYSRQVCLPEVGAEGQRRLARSRVLVIGAGGLGCPALLYLAAAGVEGLTICDGDRLEASNLHRQTLFIDADIGHNKATAAAERLRAFHPGISVKAIPDTANAGNLPDLLRGQDLVLDCTDNFDAKYAIHDAAWQAGVPLIQAAVYQYDGWVQQINPGVDAGCYRCLWPEPPPAGCVGNCAQAGVLGVTPGLLGTHQAIEAVKALLGLPDQLTDATLYINVLNGRTQRLSRPINDVCPCRGKRPWPA